MLVVFVGIQFIPTTRNQNTTVPPSDFMMVNNVPKSLQEKIQVSCYDCHSNNTQYPWYNRVQPVAWFLENHINEGKAELNFSEWSLLSERRKKSKLRSIIKQVESGEMPLNSYSLIHSDAKFSDAETKEIVKWITQLKDSL